MTAFVAAVVLSEVLIGTLKGVYHRTRPPGSLVATTGASFPSGHSIAAAVTVVAAVIALVPPGRRRAAWGAAAVGFSILMGVSRSYLAAHWLSDAIAGILLGWSCALLVAVAVNELQRRWSAHHPGQPPARPSRIRLGGPTGDELTPGCRRRGAPRATLPLPSSGRRDPPDLGERPARLRAYRLGGRVPVVAQPERAGGRQPRIRFSQPSPHRHRAGGVRGRGGAGRRRHAPTSPVRPAGQAGSGWRGGRRASRRDLRPAGRPAPRCTDREPRARLVAGQRRISRPSADRGRGRRDRGRRAVDEPAVAPGGLAHAGPGRRGTDPDRHGAAHGSGPRDRRRGDRGCRGPGGVRRS